MRVTGAADPTVPVSETMKGKLPQRKIVTTAAAGYSSYGNQIGLATGIVDEIYHPGYAAKRMEIGAVIAAAPAENVRREVPAPGDVVILLGGSTWPGEDAFLLKVYAKARAIDPTLRLILAPRHFEKADAVEANIRAAGFDCLRRSRVAQPEPMADDTVILADTTGELMGLYGLADVVFVGKSLCEHGAQNMIEPCLCGCATTVGPNTENFRPVMSDLLAHDAILQAPDAEALETTLLKLVEEPSAAKALGTRSAKAVALRCGVTPRITADVLKRV
jgi:3-deoxy-D-manno-octulosonic-acid transferase